MLAEGVTRESWSATKQPWWRGAAIYQIYPRSFADTDGNGIGDLPGITERLDYVASLGVDGVWLSPFFTSPMRDFGYDVSDYTGVDPLFGTLRDFDALVERAHELKLKVIIDQVYSHSSDQHPWFEESRSSRTDPKRDWYIWRDGPPGTEPGTVPPNNWIRSWSDQPAWTFDEATGQWYLHLFLSEQPDLNWAEPELEAAMHDVLRFWLDRGIDGFRMDVIHCIGKDPALPDDPPELAALSHVPLNDRPETHELLKRIHGVLAEYPGDRMSVGEVYLLDTKRVVSYLGGGDQLSLSFNFPPLFTRWDASKWRRQIEIVEREHNPVGAWPTWVLSNHDNMRHRSRYGSEARARAAAVMLLTLRGAPYLYAGEELGQSDAIIPDDRVVDPGGRDGCRAPIPWDADPTHGWPGADPWLPWPPDADRLNVASEQTDPSSMLHLYRRVLRVRRSSTALRTGDLSLLDGLPDGVLGYERLADDGDRRVVLLNFTDGEVEIGAGFGRDGTIEVSTDGADDGSPFSGTLGADQAVVIRP